jgi:hypothetical protein
MNFRTVWAGGDIPKPVSDALEYITKRANLIWSREHTADGQHTTIRASGPIYERGRAIAMSQWVDVPFVVANFSATGGAAWAVGVGNQLLYAYEVDGESMTVAFRITGTNLAGGPAVLQMAVPGGFVATRAVLNPIRVSNLGVAGSGLALASGAVIQCFVNVGGGLFANDAGGGIEVWGEIRFSV